jgi:cytidine deaminase
MLSPEQKNRLVQAAAKARQLAYAPYSQYRVGAALLDHNGRIFTGVNVENAAYPTSICAERTAVFKAVSDGVQSFQAIAIVTQNAGTPCGACLQVLSEFGLDIEVLLADQSGAITQNLSVREMLPYCFGPGDLEV